MSDSGRRLERDDATEKVERARRLWRAGKKRGALESLKSAVRAEPDATELRRSLAELYRELGCPDQAGRWGITVKGWTTEIEQDRLARLLASSGVAHEDMAAFLSLTSPIERYTELTVLIDGPVAKYRKEGDFVIRRRTSERSEFLTDTAELGWIITFVASLIGLVAVFAHSVLGLADPPGFARFIGLSCAVLAGLSLLTNSAAAVADRRWILATALGAGALVVTGASLAALIGLLTA